jgi:hypothetical protein
MTGNEEIPGRKRRSSQEIQRLVLEFEASGSRQNEFCRNHGLALKHHMGSHAAILAFLDSSD